MILNTPSATTNDIRPSLCQSVKAVEADIGHWYVTSIIQKWLVSHDEYSTYVQRTLPLLMAEQKSKHVLLCTHLCNNWGMDQQCKVLWINYDEKWFYGWVS